MFFFASVFRFGGFLVLQQLMEPITVYRVFTALLFTGFALQIMTTYFPQYVKAKFSAALIFKIMGDKSKIDSLSETGLKPDITGTLAFENVQFSYPMRKEAKVLKGLDFQVDVGKTLAIVGPSGCGKSTCVSLIERFYDPSEGRIVRMIDEHDLRTINTAYIRNKISLVSQEPVLFNCTIAQNVSYGLKNVTHDQIVEAARLSNIHEFVTSLPLGYETIVGDKGTQLSGGQKQRVAIARALIRSPKILILDEATSALDAESEQIVQEALDVARQGRTCIIIAHRLSTVQSADIIVVVKDGAIIEKGSHAELIAQRGAYFELTRKQAILS